MFQNHIIANFLTLLVYPILSEIPMVMIEFDALRRNPLKMMIAVRKSTVPHSLVMKKIKVKMKILITNYVQKMLT